MYWWIRQHLRFTALVLVVIGVMSGIGFWVYASAQYTQSITLSVNVQSAGNPLAFYSNSSATIALTSLDFGSMQRGTSKTATFWLKNIGPVPVTVTSDASLIPTTLGTIIWSYDGYMQRTLQPGQVTTVMGTLTLNVAAPIGTATPLANFVATEGDLPTPTPKPVPAVPTGLTGTAPNSSQVNLVWTETDTSATGYSLKRATDSAFSQSVTAFTIATNTTSYSDTSTVGSTTYYYEVAAVNASGTSAYSIPWNVTTPAPLISFSAQVQPLLTTYCVACHTGVSGMGGVDLSTYAGVQATVIPSSSALSLMTHALNGTYGSIQMPPGGTLTAAQIAVITGWIDQGAANN